jgi:DNA-binding MarR family transcriptional regulator
MNVVSVGEWTIPMAADRLGTSRQAVQRIANDLVNSGLAVFVDNPNHRRSPLVHLTNEGREILVTISDQTHLLRAALLLQVSERDLADLRSALNRLTAKVRAELDA